MKARDFPHLVRRKTAIRKANAAKKRAARVKELRMCLTKTAYSSEAVAQAVIAKRSGKINSPSGLASYRCAYCSMWHLTGSRAPLG